MIQHLIDAASLGSLYALMALGIALVFGVMRLVNFAYGEFIMVGAYATLVVSGAGWPVVILATLVAVMALALVTERVAFRPARGVDPATLLIISFAISIGLQAAVILIAGARPKSVDIFGSLTEPIQLGDAQVPIIDVVTILVTAGLILGLTLFLRRTTLGLQLRAAAEDFTVTRLLGVKADVVFATAFAASGVLAAVAALVITTQSGVLSPSMGLLPVLVAFVATVIGGLGSLVGAACGGFVLGALTVAFQTGLPLEARPYRDAFVFAAVILILLLRPGGLAGSRALEERV